ncbi:CDK-activating kinase assembly factor MAT1-like [Clavelina lepadiformis]|uniref:CDK-activating kinase assembly factor MAT1-like n=1 Tax=Clavelina lepadiformis TaxID=159417 RepID=UPI004041E273
MDELSCPRCRMTKYRNPSLRLLINACGHALCEACVELVFTRESAPCPDCGRSLRRNDFRMQLFEDTRVDKEVDIRKSVLKIYNKQETDFNSLNEYNDYLEVIEEIVWNLESGKNEKETKERIALYKQENEPQIRRNQVRITQERSYFKEQVAQEAKERELRAQMLRQIDKEADAARRLGEEKLLNDLAKNSSLSSAEVLERHRKLKLEEEKTRNISSLEERMSIGGFNNEADDVILSNRAIPESEKTFKHTPMVVDITGPSMPNRNAIFESGYLRHVREARLQDLGGGYTSVLACERALYDAFGGLYFSPASTAHGVM